MSLRFDTFGMSWHPYGFETWQFIHDVAGTTMRHVEGVITPGNSPRL
jgi:hypothetical protein